NASPDRPIPSARSASWRVRSKPARPATCSSWPAPAVASPRPGTTSRSRCSRTSMIPTPETTPPAPGSTPSAATDAASRCGVPRTPLHPRPRHGRRCRSAQRTRNALRVSCPAPVDDRARARMSVAATFEIEYLQYLGPDGTLVADLPPEALPAAEILPLFKQMLMVRTFDTKAIALQRTGKLGTYAASLGHEATHIGIGAAMRPEDVFAPSYREYGAQFMRGVKPRDVLMYWGGDERGNDFSGPKHDFPWCVPIATQCLHAAGAALSFKLRGEDRVAVTCCGDGG